MASHILLANNKTFTTSYLAPVYTGNANSTQARIMPTATACLIGGILRSDNSQLLIGSNVLDKLAGHSRGWLA